MSVVDFTGEAFVQIVWEGVLDFIGACVKFPFSRKRFREVIKDGANPLIGVAVVGMIIFLVIFLK